MNILLVNRWYPPYTGFGGVAAYSYYLAHALTNLGHSVHVLAARYDQQTPALQSDGSVTIYRMLFHSNNRLNRLPLFGRFYRPFLQWMYSKQVASFIRSIAAFIPDVVEFADINAEGFHYLHKKQKCPIVVRCHTPTFVLRNYYQPNEIPYDTLLTSTMEKFCINHADLLTAPSKDMATTISTCLQMNTGRITVIPNPLDTSLFDSQNREVWPDPNCITILHVGRMERVKGVEILTRAIPIVVRSKPNVRFVFVGDDLPDHHGTTWQARLREFLDLEGVIANVSFLGPLPQTNLIRQYHLANIVVVPTLNYESFSYTCAQAMAAGLPIIASEIGGIPETIGDAGILVQPGNIYQLADALLRLINDRDLQGQLGQRARQTAFERFSADRVAQNMITVYQQLL